MTAVVTYPLGLPRPAPLRGGDCRGRDLDKGHNVFGLHRFEDAAHCQIDNGLIRCTVGASGAAPSLIVAGMTGYQPYGDIYYDIYDDIYPGSYTGPGWTAMGSIVIDSPLVSALLTGVRLVNVNDERITIRLISPVMADAYVTLRRGEPMVRIQHGSTRVPSVSTSRRVWWDHVGLTGAAATARVAETAPLTDGFARFVAARDAATANAGAFSITASAVISAEFGAGVGTAEYGSTVEDLHSQLSDVSRTRLVVEEVDA